MKKLLFFAILVLWVSPVFASGWFFTGGAAVVCDDCSGTLKFSAHFENDVDVEVGNPCGCSDGDTTAALTGAAFSAAQAYDGSYSILFDADNDEAIFAINAADIFNEEDFKVSFRIYITTFEASAIVARYYADGGDRVDIIMGDAVDDIRFTASYKGNTTEDTMVITNENGRVLNEWIFIEVKGKYNVAGDDFQIKVCDANGTSNCQTVLEDDDLVQMDDKPTTIIFGGVGVNNSVFYIDTPTVDISGF